MLVTLAIVSRMSCLSLEYPPIWHYVLTGAGSVMIGELA